MNETEKKPDPLEKLKAIAEQHPSPGIRKMNIGKVRRGLDRSDPERKPTTLEDYFRWLPSDGSGLM